MKSAPSSAARTISVGVIVPGMLIASRARAAAIISGTRIGDTRKRAPARSDSSACLPLSTVPAPTMEPRAANASSFARSLMSSNASGIVRVISTSRTPASLMARAASRASPGVVVRMTATRRSSPKMRMRSRRRASGRCVIAIYVMVRASGRSGLVATPSELCHERGGHRELKGHAGSPQATTRHGDGWASPTPRSAALCAIDPEHPLRLLDAGPVRPGDVAGDREAPAPHDLLEAGTRRVGVGVHAEDEAAPRRDDVGEQMVDEVAATARRNVFQPGAHEVEAQGRRPGEPVADEDAVGPPWQTRAGERGELGDDVEPVRLDPDPLRRTPLDERLHEQTVRAADVEERAVAIHRVGDEPAGMHPARGVTGETGLRLGCGSAQVRGPDDVGNACVPARLVDLAALQCLIDLGDERAGAIAEAVVAGHASRRNTRAGAPSPSSSLIAPHTRVQSPGATAPRSRASMITTPARSSVLWTG